MDDLRQITDDLRGIRVDQTRYRPLGLDRMFDRAIEWKKSEPSAPGRAPSPTRMPTVYPLPLPSTSSVSPIGGLFGYSELIPHVLKWFEKPAELATLARVSWGFNDIVKKKLYGHIWIRPWEAHCDEKLLLLFRTLQDSEELCRLVRSLDVRFFPLATKDTERYDLDDRVNKAFRQMTNLEQLVWTRDKSLNPEMIKILSTSNHLRTLEISGHSRWYYDASLIGDMPALEDLRVMLPDRQFRDALNDVLRKLSDRPQGGLKGLGIIARTSPLVDDAFLRESAEHLKELRRLTLWGCSRVTREGVYAILRQAEYLEDLSVDATQTSGMLDLTASPPLPNLTALSLSFAPPHRTPIHPHFTHTDLPLLPAAPKLSSLLLTLSSDRAIFPSFGIENLSERVDFSNLTRLSILNLFCTADTLSTILALGRNLEELYISVTAEHVIYESTLISGSIPSKLRILHLNAPEKRAPSLADLTSLARELSLLEQVGTGNRVYEVHRRYHGNKRVVELCRWSRTFTPGYFQNWRG